MSVGLFIDKNHSPTEADIAAAIGPMLPLWKTLIQFIRDTYAVQEDFRFLYGKTHGWALRFRVKGKLLTALYPTQSGFTVQIILGPTQVTRAMAMGLPSRVMKVLLAAKPWPEGRWLFIPVTSVADMRDIQQLLALRVETKRLAKRTAT